MIGRTITHVDTSNDYELAIHLDDGTVFVAQAMGYEVEAIEYDRLTPEQRRRRTAQRQGERESERHRLELMLARDEMRRRRIEAKRAELSEEEFQAWYQEHHGLSAFSKAMRDTFQGTIADQMKGMNRLLFGSAAIIPLDSATDDDQDGNVPETQ